MTFQSTYQNRRVLVTGDTGFKGSWLCEWLLRMGADVHGIALPPNTEPALYDQLDLVNRINHTDLDIRDREALREKILDIKPEIVFHLAAQPLVRLSYETPVETYATNVMGTVHLLDAIRHLSTQGHSCAVVCITTDKCYENKEWLHAYREEDPMGGHDPYSSSKGACELAIQSYRDSFFSLTTNNQQLSTIALASARAGNVIGGGDWALDRIVPDCVRALAKGDPIPVRNKIATRPWQHVLEPLSGYLLLASRLHQQLPTNNHQPSTNNQQLSTNNQQLSTNNHQLTTYNYCTAFNFGPALSSNRTVADLVNEAIKHWPGQWQDRSDPNAVHEASLLNLSTDKAFHMLNWQPKWDFETTISRTIHWYKAAHNGANIRDLVDADLAAYAG